MKVCMTHNYTYYIEQVINMSLTCIGVTWGGGVRCSPPLFFLPKKIIVDNEAEEGQIKNRNIFKMTI